MTRLWQRRQKVVQRLDRRAVGDAVGPRGAEMALEGGDDSFGALVEAAGDVDAIAVEGEHRLQRLHRLAGIAALEEAAAADFCRLDEMAYAGRGEKRPGDRK